MTVKHCVGQFRVDAGPVVVNLDDEPTSHRAGSEPGHSGAVVQRIVEEHIEGYGDGIEQRLTGQHETAPYNVFNYGVSDRGASVRIPWQVEVDKKGYIEDRRPNANCDPYEVTYIMIDTICSALA